MKNESKESNVIITQNMMTNAARGCVQTMEILLKKNELDLTSWHIPFYILATTALELFPKIVLSHNEQYSGSVSQITKKFKDFGHNLDDIYSKKGVGCEFLKMAGISRVLKVVDQDNFVYRFDFYQDEKSQAIQVYDMESLRYGLMTNNKSNASTVAYQFDELLSLCTSVESAFMRKIL